MLTRCIHASLKDGLYVCLSICQSVFQLFRFSYISSQRKLRSHHHTIIQSSMRTHHFALWMVFSYFLSYSFFFLSFLDASSCLFLRFCPSFSMFFLNAKNFLNGNHWGSPNWKFLNVLNIRCTECAKHAPGCIIGPLGLTLSSSLFSFYVRRSGYGKGKCPSCPRLPEKKALLAWDRFIDGLSVY